MQRGGERYFPRPPTHAPTPIATSVNMASFVYSKSPLVSPLGRHSSGSTERIGEVETPCELRSGQYEESAQITKIREMSAPPHSPAKPQLVATLPDSQFTAKVSVPWGEHSRPGQMRGLTRR